MEVQLTDFENAAFTVFVVLVSRVILYFNLNFYMCDYIYIILCLIF